MIKKCLVCDGKSFNNTLKTLSRCNNCGFVTYDMTSTKDHLKEIYNDDYFSGGEYRNYIADRDVIQNNFKLRFKVLNKYLNSKHRKLFEIGSAYGFFLDSVKHHFDLVSGIDITNEGCVFAREQLGINVIEGDYLDYAFEYKPDVFCMWDTIEHLPDPDLFIAKISQDISSDGLLCITTGDIDSFVARIRGPKWRLIHPPTHIHYFSRKTIIKLLNKYGFEIVHFEHCGFYRSLDLILYQLLVIQNKSPKLYRYLERKGITKAKIYSNLYDIMFVIARKL